MEKQYGYNDPSLDNRKWYLMIIDLSSLKITLGPLRYQFLAYDSWSRQVLAMLRENLDCNPFTGDPKRVIHLLEFPLTLTAKKEICSEKIPKRLISKLNLELPFRGWKSTGDETGFLCWCHPDSPHTIWTYLTIPAQYEPPYQIPWMPILEDMAGIGGGILHAGLAVYSGMGYLFLAPPGGGKTTALSRIPFPWKVLADDASLVWPCGDNSFVASPLPTWSVLLGVNKKAAVIDLWRVGEVIKVGGAFILEKWHQGDRLADLPRNETILNFYRGLIEHPMALYNSLPMRKGFFNTACEAARVIPIRRLELGYAGEFWKLIEIQSSIEMGIVVSNESKSTK